MDSRLILRPRPLTANSNGVTPGDKPGVALERPRLHRKRRCGNQAAALRAGREAERIGNPAAFAGQEKPPLRGHRASVPQTDTGGRG